MPIALLCSAWPLEEELRETALWRQDVERRMAASSDEALQKALDSRPDIVALDRDLPGALRLVAALRRDQRTRTVSIAVLARGDMRASEVELMASGANAILRLPPDAEWADRLPRLMSVPARRDVRLPVYIEIEARSGIGVESGLATVVNLSVSGMLLETDFRLELGDVLDLRFRLPDSTGPVVGSGRVVRRGATHRFALEFFGLEGEGADEVRRFVEARHGSASRGQGPAQ
jgi:CheY-like chemotaxis protein